MKNMFTKFLLFAGAVGLFAGCNKEEKTDSANYLEIGGKKTEIVFGVKTDGGSVGYPAGSMLVELFGKGAVMTNGLLAGVANNVVIVTSSVPGEHLTSGLERSLPTAQYFVNFDPSATSGTTAPYESMAFLVKDSKIVWSQNGKTYTVDLAGNTVDMDGAAAQPFKVHFSGELMEIQPE